MDSAHHLTEIKHLGKFNENHFKGLGDKEQARNSRVNLITLSLHYKLSHGFCTPSHVEELWAKFNENLSKGSGDMELTQNTRVSLMTLKCDLDLESA